MQVKLKSVKDGEVICVEAVKAECRYWKNGLGHINDAYVDITFEDGTVKYYDGYVLE